MGRRIHDRRMKNYIRATITILVLYIIGVVVFAFIISRPSDESVDTVKLNDIARNVEQNWDSLQSLDTKDYGVSFIVLGNNNTVLYRQSSELNSDSAKTDEVRSLEDAIKKRYPYQNVSVDDMIVGTVVMLENPDGGISDMTKKVIIALIIGGIILMISAIGFGLYVKKNIITPFDRMKDFAGKVAQGNLDEPLLMEKSNMFGAFTESFDIMREELGESRKRELELQRKEKELVASLSHDLKTPITGIKLTTELLKAKVDMNRHKNESDSKELIDVDEKLDNIYKKADQIDVLVSDLFSSTLDDLGEFKVKCDDEESTLISEIIKKNDDKKLVSESWLPKVIINIDRNRLNQVIGNIIVNSYKYAGTKIDVEYKLVDGFLEMKLQDYGPGVPKNELELITNKFYRGENTEESKKEGSGLGLYIAKNLMEKMNGELICESEGEGKGLGVVLMIPLS